MVLRQRWPAAVVDGAGLAVTVDARGGLSGAPARLAVTAPEQPPGEWWWSGVAGWAGPWPVDERWWDPDRKAGRTARAQVLLDTDERSRVEQGGSPGRALLLCYRQRRWYLEGIYE